MKDKVTIQILCQIQDINKKLRLESDSEERLRECEEVEQCINEQLKSLYIN